MIRPRGKNVRQVTGQDLRIYKKSKLKKNISKDFVPMKSKFDSKCATCNKKINKGSAIKYFRELKKATHPNCKGPDES